MVRPINLNDSAITVPDSLKQQVSLITGATPLPIEETTWISSYYLDFRKRLQNLLGYEFRQLPCSLAFQFIGEKNQN